MPSTRTILWVTTLLSAFVFLGMTVDSLHKMGARTHADQLSAQVVEGKWLWQRYDCNDCHTILGIGGYYAPDVTKSYAIRGDAWLRQFLREPGKMHPTGRQMPNFHLEARPETRFLAVSRTISPLFPIPQFLKRPFSDEPLVLLC